MKESESDEEDDVYAKADTLHALAVVAKGESDVPGQNKGREPSPGSTNDQANTSVVQKDPPRLLIISSKVKLASAIVNAALPNVTCVQYKYDTCTLDGILAAVAQSLANEQQVESMALILNCSGPVIYLCGKDEKVITKECILESDSIREFLSTLVINHLDRSWVNARLDFLMCSAALTIDGGIIAKETEDMIGVPVGISKDLYGTDIPYQRVGDETGELLTIGQLYFRVEKLRAWSSSNPQSLAGFEKIRLVGKGAYGTAVLYRKKDDDTLVILKEINMHDLNASERQMALNEVRVLAMLEHPNIIGYYDSFEEEGVLMIEMEYADGGTLAQYLSGREQTLDEREILEKFAQIVSALKHIHGHNVLHRDLKTANIFLTKDGIVKLGDFGISKMMTTGGKVANTVLGTPYYISPEICEGKAYGDKSDIWALGCILYEMACLQKTFEGSNLPALVNKIVNGQFAPVKGNYSNEFKELVQVMLDKDPYKRPSAVELCTKWLPPLLSRYEVMDPGDTASSRLLSNGKNRKTISTLESRSAVYYLETFNMSLHPIEMPTRIKIKEVSVSASHAVVVTTEHMVYSWGDGGKGQLGHGDFEPRNTPHLVDALKGKSITKACCGDRFSAFSCNNGIAMTCGDGSKGCLGHGDWQTLAKPKLVESLLHMDVVSLACGLHHVVAVGNKGVVYAWGKGADGRLGTGTEDDEFIPVKVAMPDDVFVTKAFCGMDGTMLVTDIGAIWAFGNNRYNKLGLNNRQGFLAAFKNAFSKTEVEGTKAPAAVRDLGRHKIIDISMGPSHTAVVAESGNVYALGRNLEGQLGTGSAKEFNGLNHVKSLEKTRAVKVWCSDLYTAVSTADGQLLFWGTKYASPPLPSSLDSSSGERVKSSLICVQSGSPSAAAGSGSGSADIAAVAHAGSNELSSSDAAAMAGDASQSGGNARTQLQAVQVTHTMAGRRTSPVPGGQPEGASADTAPPVTSPAPLSDVHMDWEAAVRGSTTPTPPVADQQAITSKKSGDDSAAAASRRPLSGAPKRSNTGAAPAKDKAGEKPDKVVGTGGDECTAYFQPTPLLHMNSEQSESVVLSDFCCHGENMLLLVETTAPPAGRRLRKRRSLQAIVTRSALAVDTLKGASSSTATSQDTTQHETSSGASEMDTVGMAASWIRRELSDNEVVRPPRGFEGARSGRRGGGGAGLHRPAAASLQSLSDGDLESVEGDDDDDGADDDDIADDDDGSADDDDGGDADDGVRHNEDDKAEGRWAVTAQHEQLQAGGGSGSAARDSAPPHPAGARHEPAHYYAGGDSKTKASRLLLSLPAVQQPTSPLAAASAEAKRSSSSSGGGGGEGGIRTIDDLASERSDSPERVVSSAPPSSKDAAAAAAASASLKHPESHPGTSAGRPQRDGGQGNGGGGSLQSAATKLVVVPRSAPRSPKHRRQPLPAVHGSTTGHEHDADWRSSAGSGSSTETAHRLGPVAAAADDRVRALVDQLMEEKRHQEQRIKDMEERHREREQHVRAEAQRSVAERELLMQEEIKKLREELALQHQQMQENIKMLFMLQQQLIRASGSQPPLLVTPEQHLHQQQQQQAHPEAKSKVCSIQ